jgi:hypothetical protein
MNKILQNKRVKDKEMKVRELRVERCFGKEMKFLAYFDS